MMVAEFSTIYSYTLLKTMWIACHQRLCGLPNIVQDPCAYILVHILSRVHRPPESPSPPRIFTDIAYIVDEVSALSNTLSIFNISHMFYMSLLLVAHLS
jgi:hypothetical protein